MATRIGPSMHYALRYVRDHDGAVSSAFELARAVGPNGSAQYGYEIVGRCVKAGLLAYDPDHLKAAANSNGAVVLTEAGESALTD